MPSTVDFLQFAAACVPARQLFVRRVIILLTDSRNFVAQAACHLISGSTAIRRGTSS